MSASSAAETFGVKKRSSRIGGCVASTGLATLGDWLTMSCSRLARALRSGLAVSFAFSNQNKRGASRQDAGRSVSDHTTAHKDAPHDISASGSIRYWIVGATGFRQDSAHESGLELLWREMRSLKSEGVCITTPFRWDEDAEAKAAFIARNSAPGAVVLMYAYSYGVGSFFVKFARALKRYGIRIARLISVDGIRRWLALKPLSLRWFQDKVTIAIPDNVDVAFGFRQEEDRWLRGHRLFAEDPCVDGQGSTTVIDWQLHGSDHCSIDESSTVHHVALTEFAGVIEGSAV